jgi:hypothetical protein
MGEKGRIRAALAILTVTGSLVIYSAVDPSFKVPAELWGLATGASLYLFSTGRLDSHHKEDD